MMSMMARAPESVSVQLSESWSLGAMFGGAVAAGLVGAGARALGGSWVPLLVAVSFHRPVPTGTLPAAVETVHRGRTTATTRLVLGEEKALASAHVTWGAPQRLVRADAVEPAELPAAAEPAPGDLSPMADFRLVGGWPAGTGPGAAHGVVDAWIRPRHGWWHETGGRRVLDPRWYLVAADLIGPALLAAGVRGPFRVVTVSLAVAVHALTSSTWLRQRVTARMCGDLAVGQVELMDASGTVIATATQHAVLSPAQATELPVAVTGFGWGGPRPVAVNQDRTDDRY
ncbi:thioesterase family protein [Georgenia yuyongxinii]|uniref:Thioesterase family protein n=2 Tax=Georgenia yuyongxinii TaxID=2589797 RepID=A0A552WXU7_9MICO|nr:thioesterase family protein [Georgenia yuyongxinii]